MQEYHFPARDMLAQKKVIFALTVFIWMHKPNCCRKRLNSGNAGVSYLQLLQQGCFCVVPLFCLLGLPVLLLCRVSVHRTYFKEAIWKQGDNIHFKVTYVERHLPLISLQSVYLISPIPHKTTSQRKFHKHKLNAVSALISPCTHIMINQNAGC